MGPLFTSNAIIGEPHDICLLFVSLVDFEPMNAKRSTGGRTHRFGGDWTSAKLDVIARYLASYTTALKDKPSEEHPFVKGYIDAFRRHGVSGRTAR